MMRTVLIAAMTPVLLCPGVAGAAALDEDVDFYVSRAGSDKNPGTSEEEAFATPARGLKQVAALRAKGHTGRIFLTLLPGDHFLTEPLRIGPEHSGLSEVNGKSRDTVIVGAEGPVPARLLGGAKLSGFVPLAKDSPLRRRIPAAVADKVMQVDLRALGVKEIAPLVQCGFGMSRKAGHSQLYIDGSAAPLAGWPNDGGFVRLAAKVSDRTMRTAEGRPKQWATTDGAWAYGYWYHDWADSYHPITAFDAGAGTITLGGKKPPVYGFRKGQRYRYLNVPEELDAPGEWHIDHASGILAVYPPAGVDMNQADVLLSTLGETMVIMREAYCVNLRRLVIEAGRGGGVRVERKRRLEPENTGFVDACIFRCLGKTAVVVEGYDCRVNDCLLYNLAEGGVALSGGDRESLTPARLQVENCHIHDFGQWCRTYQPGVKLAGAGTRVSHCHIHHAPHAGILLSGNYHYIERCEIDHVALQTGDVGAIYLGRDWTFRGNVVESNHFHDIGGLGMGAMGVYNDDCASGTLIRGNLFERVRRAVMIGGGRDITATGNIFVDCEPAVHFDGRGLVWKQPRQPDKYPSWDLVGKLRKLPYNRPPWSEKFPELARILDENPWAPMNNRFEGNIVLGGKLLWVSREARPFWKPANNLVIEKPTADQIKAILAQPEEHLERFHLVDTEQMGPDEAKLKAALPGGKQQ